MHGDGMNGTDGVAGEMGAPDVDGSSAHLSDDPILQGTALAPHRLLPGVTMAGVGVPQWQAAARSHNEPATAPYSVPMAGEAAPADSPRCFQCARRRRGDVSSDCWRRVAWCLTALSLVLALSLAGLVLFYFYFEGCRVWLSDVRITELPRVESENQLESAVIVRVRNPTHSTATLSSADLHISLLEHTPSGQVLYDTVQSLKYPSAHAWSEFGNDSIHIGPSRTEEVSIRTVLQFRWDNVSTLVRGRCFSYEVEGSVKYHLSAIPFNTVDVRIDRSMQLFSTEACPCTP
eukprot:TRINITY_DN5443_c1_g1_i1.p1 TRINITY_DN5443_c1_g1~~TRINITY_DN5443_c1_g1_i1.p1  ORF type:complete len:290 (+),score=44.04 TRINITY_DN5443_c1_g1_i1:70-939(+)